MGGTALKNLEQTIPPTGTISNIVTLSIPNSNLTTLFPKIPNSSSYYSLVQLLLPNNSINSLDFLAHCGGKSLRILDISNNLLNDFSGVMYNIKKFGKGLEYVDIRMNLLTKDFYPRLVSRSSVNETIPINEDNETETFKTMDEGFRKTLTDSVFVKRQCYVSSIIHSLIKSLRVLDGLVVEEQDRKNATRVIRKLRKVKKDAFSIEGISNNHSSEKKSQGVANEEKNETDLLFENWKPISFPLENATKSFGIGKKKTTYTNKDGGKVFFEF